MVRESKLKELKEYIEELKVLEKKEVERKDESFLSMKTFECLLNNNKLIRREKILKNGKEGNASVILPITKEGNVILVVQPRVFTSSSVLVELPAGYIEDTEEPEIAALRELEEETGYVSNNIKLITSFYQDSGCMGALNYSFIAFDCEKRHDQRLDKDEYIRFFECTYDECLELIDLGYIKDANSIITLERSKKHIKRR